MNDHQCRAPAPADRVNPNDLLPTQQSPVPDVSPNRTHAAVTALVLAAGFLTLAIMVRVGVDALLRADRQVVITATDITRPRPALEKILLVGQAVFYPAMMYLYAVPVVLWAIRSGERRRATWAIMTMAVGWALAAAAKVVVARPRPVIVDPVSHASGSSFPSGHAANAAVMVTTCLILVWPLPGTRRHRWNATLVGAVIVLLTMADRVFLGVHYPSDVLAGAMMGVAVSTASWAACGRRARSRVARSS